MLDILQLRNDIEAVALALKKRNYSLDSERFREVDSRCSELKRGLQDLQTTRRERAKKIEKLVLQGMTPDEAKKQCDDASESDFQAQLDERQDAVRDAQVELDNFMLDIPNIPDEQVPVGASEDDNKVVDTWGEPPKFDFEPKDHMELSNTKIDGESAATLAGARFTVLRGDMARLHRALTQFMLDVHAKNGYEEHYVPYIANSASLRGTGQLPKFADDLFALSNASDMYLIPTAEVPLTNLYADRILDYPQLAQPIKLMAHTPCFRREAGNYGRDTRGMFRQHQFEKVELVQLCQPDHAQEALAQLCADAESVLRQLDLPYRKVLLCTGDMGFAARCTYDLEVWLPSQKRYREISSCSDFGSFQARRMGLRWRNSAQKAEKVFVNTLNGSGVAVGRCLIALLENHQTGDGTLKLPAALVPYMDGKEQIDFAR